TGDMKIHAFKNNTSPDGTSYGSHENYCVSRDVPFPGQYLRDLVPHLATRFIYTGAGDILRGKYVLSPMAFLTSQVISGETMHDTGILNTRDEPHADGRVWRRLHVIVGDALMNETAIMLRHFTTSAVLQLMEDGRLDGVQAVLGNWCGAIPLLQASAGGPRRTHDGRRCYQKGNSRTAERHPRSPSSGTMRHLQYRDD